MLENFIKFMVPEDYAFDLQEMRADHTHPAQTFTGDGASLGTIPGKAPTSSGTVGTSNSVAREDHTHPLQTMITGNAATATRLTMPRTFRLTGAVTGNAQFSGDADCVITTTLVGGGGDVPFWTGTADQLPQTMDPDTIYFVYEN